MIKKIILGLLLGIVGTLFFVQYDPQMQGFIEQRLADFFQEAYQCNFSCSMRYVSLLWPVLELENLHCCSLIEEMKWKWNCKKAYITFSWIDFITTGTVDLALTFEGVHLVSGGDIAHRAIIDHFQKFFLNSQFIIPINIKSIAFNKAVAHVHDDVHYDIKLEWSSQSKRMQDIFKTHIKLIDAQLKYEDRMVCTQSAGSIAFQAVKSNDQMHYIVDTDIRSYFLPLQQGGAYSGYCFLTGRWHDCYGRFQIYNNDHSVMINPVIVTYKNGSYQFEIAGSMPIDCIANVLNISNKMPITGSAYLTVKGSFDAFLTLQSNIIVDNCGLKDYGPRGVAKCSFTKNNHLWSGDINVRAPSIGKLVGNWQWDDQQSDGFVHIDNHDTISIPHIMLNIPPYGFFCEFKKLSSGVLLGNYRSKFIDRVQKLFLTTQGQINIENGACLVDGKTGDGDYYVFSWENNKKPYLKLFSYINQQGDQLLTLNNTGEKWLVGSVDLLALRFLINRLFHYDLQAKGKINLAIYAGQDELFGKISLADGSSIRLPETYNFIKGMSCLWKWDVDHKSIKVFNFLTDLHTGKIFSKEMMFYFPSYTDWYCHVPCIMDRCLLNISHNLFAMVSGSIICKKMSADAPILKTRLMIERAQLKENIFSYAWGGRWSSLSPDFSKKKYNLLCDAIVETKELLRVDTSFMQADAQMFLHAVGNIQMPELSGYISMPVGLLKFPYKSLNITKGMLTFGGEKIQDPLIELIAQNRLRTHDVRLHVSGSINDHCILLTANPPLTQEQILSLLVVGSSQASFNMLMPALLINNMRNLLLGSSQSDIFDHLFKSYGGPLAINLVPSFIDQTGRGGLRGAIEITVNDRLRALIQKNFSLTEDTRFELEYAITDDITIRAIRDERSDIGTEIEMRWKF